MTLLRASFYFRIRGLLVHPDLLGSSHELVEVPNRIVLTLPTTDAPESARSDVESRFPGDDPPLSHVGGSVRGSISFGPAEGLAKVNLVRAHVFVESSLSAADFEDGHELEHAPFEHPVSALLWENLEAARSAVGRFLEWVRVGGSQNWLGLSALEPEAVGHAELADTAAWALLPESIDTESHVLRRVDESQVLSEESLAAATAAARSGTPALGPRLLSDAAYYAWESEPPDSDRAIIVAAIACEVGIKDALRRCTEGTVSELLDVLLDNPRDWSMSAISLWDKPAKVIFGRSLREDDKALYTETQRVFERRNAVAHRGESYPAEDAATSVRSVASAFRWLREVSGSPPPV